MKSNTPTPCVALERQVVFSDTLVGQAFTRLARGVMALLRTL